MASKGRKIKLNKRQRKAQKKLNKFVKKKVVSQRGRYHPMAAPAGGMPQQPQNIFNESTVIQNFRYSGRKQRLIIIFQSGHEYEYFGVPLRTVELLANAPSKGHYFYYNIRTSFKYRRVK